jgi:hypothetical protein
MQAPCRTVWLRVSIFKPRWVFATKFTYKRRSGGKWDIGRELAQEKKKFADGMRVLIRIS